MLEDNGLYENTYFRVSFLPSRIYFNIFFIFLLLGGNLTLAILLT